MISDLSVLSHLLLGKCGTGPEVRSWYRYTHRKLRSMGFIPLGRGNFANGLHRVMIRFSHTDDDVMAMVRITGPEQIYKPRNLYKIPNIKFLCLNAAGDICRIPAKSWDRKRKSRSITEL